MAVIQKGLGVAWGITSTAYTFAGSAKVLTPEEIGYEKEAEILEHKNRVGETCGLVIFDQKQRYRLRVYPNGASLAAPEAITLPAIGDSLAITDSTDADIATTTAVVTRCSKARRQADKVFFDVEATEFAADLSATIS